MNKYEKALNNVRMFEREHNMSKFGDVVPQPNSDILQELVDKETPMKVEYFKDDKTLEIYNAQCPTCKYIFGYDFIPINELGKKYRQHCPRCGKKIKWGDECE